jgi:hypothetical protein
MIGFISDQHVKEICKPGQMEKTCRYLLMGPKGWECGKSDPTVKNVIDEKVARMSAQSDNCGGVQ